MPFFSDGSQKKRCLSTTGDFIECSDYQVFISEDSLKRDGERLIAKQMHKINSTLGTQIVYSMRYPDELTPYHVLKIVSPIHKKPGFVKIFTAPLLSLFRYRIGEFDFVDGEISRCQYLDD